MYSHTPSLHDALPIVLGSLGIKAAKYNFNILGIPRTPSERGRGGAVLSTYRADQVTDADRPTRAGQVSTDQMWERITHFLERVVPRSEEHTSELQSLMRISYAVFCLNKKQTPV